MKLKIFFMNGSIKIYENKSKWNSADAVEVAGKIFLHVTHNNELILAAPMCNVAYFEIVEDESDVENG